MVDFAQDVARAVDAKLNRGVDTESGDAKRINDLHAQATKSAKNAVELAIRCGELLTKKKADLKHGEWQAWVKANCDFSYQTAALYMKAAKEKSNGLDFSAVRHLYGPPKDTKKKPAPTGEHNNGIDALEQSVIASLPKGTGKATINATVRGLRKEEKKLRHEFSRAVEKEAEARAKIARANMKLAEQRANEQYDRALKKAAGVKAFLTREEFQLIRSCLHPDKNSHPQAAKAFRIFNKLADVKDW